MGLYVQRDQKRSELQERVAEELREKARAAREREPERRDGVSDSPYLDGTKRTTSLAWAWIIILIAAIGVAIFIIIRSMSPAL